MGNPNAGASKMSHAPGVPAAFGISQMPNSYEPWSVGLCDCFSDCGRGCISCWCPYITFGQVSEIIDKGSSSCCVNGGIYYLISAFTGCGCIYSCVYRSKMREMLKLQGNWVKDCLIHCCCEPCALTQMYRELQNRGFEVSLGWHGNVERQTRGVTMAPPMMEGGMQLTLCQVFYRGVWLWEFSEI